MPRKTWLRKPHGISVSRTIVEALRKVVLKVLPVSVNLAQAYTGRKSAWWWCDCRGGFAREDLMKMVTKTSPERVASIAHSTVSSS
jgi:hypothetical protein